ncbi:MAG TPA: DUF5994 family protein [Kribbella sp.]|nr:DUF5994 family protein [Kribbella sp.]
MTLTANDGRTVFSATEPSTPRLRLRSGGTREVLDGGWWPRSTDPVAEIPGLVLAIDAVRGPITRMMLASGDWESHPRRLAVNGRLVRLGYFNSQPPGLLIALSGGADARVDLAVIPPGTTATVAEVALTLAATRGNRIHAQNVVPSASAAAASSGSRSAERPEDAWETDGGHVAGTKTPDLDDDLHVSR